jgi:hypothetical protein
MPNILIEQDELLDKIFLLMFELMLVVLFNTNAEGLDSGFELVKGNARLSLRDVKYLNEDEKLSTYIELGYWCKCWAVNVVINIKLSGMLESGEMRLVDCRSVSLWKWKEWLYCWDVPWSRGGKAKKTGKRNMKRNLTNHKSFMWKHSVFNRKLDINIFTEKKNNVLVFEFQCFIFDSFLYFLSNVKHG